MSARGFVRLLLPLAAWLSLGCGSDPGPEPAEFLNHDPAVAYIGIQECRSCHLNVYSTYKDTGMGRSFYPMTAEVAVEDFRDDNEFAVPGTGLRYRMIERGGRYYQRQFLVGSAGEEVAVDERELVYVVGSNNHNRSYVVVEQDKLFQAPICWYPQVEQWDLCPGFEHKNDSFSREIGNTCVFCHNGVMRRVEGQRNQFEQPFPHGVGCERCHGPGELHAARWSSGDDTPGGEADPTIVHPRRLSVRKRLQLCGQCHLADAKATERVARHDRSLESFRPGESLSAVMTPFRYVDQTQFDFGLSSQVDRLTLSRCFTESRDRLDCVTCHNPHITVYHEDRPPDFFSRKCLACHANEDCTAPSADRQATTPKDNCVECHMRRAEPDDQRHTAFTDHWIRRRIDFDTRDSRATHDVEPVFPKEYERLPPGDRAYARARASFLLANDAPARARPAMWSDAEQGFLEAIEAGFDTADAWFFLSKTRLGLGRPAEALEALEIAVERDPEHHDAVFALGQGWVAKGELDRAVELFERLLERNPDDPMALAELGRTDIARKRYGHAVDRFRRAAELEPWNARLMTNLGRAYVQAGRIEEATKAADRAVRLAPLSAPTWEFYANVMAVSGKDAEAAEGRLQLSRLSR